MKKKIFVHAAYDHSDISDFLGDPKKLRASQYHNVAQGTYYELLVEANLDLFCSFA